MFDLDSGAQKIILVKEDLVELGHIALNQNIEAELTALANKLKSEDKLLSDRQLSRYTDTFRERFGLIAVLSRPLQSFLGRDFHGEVLVASHPTSGFAPVEDREFQGAPTSNGFRRP